MSAAALLRPIRTAVPAGARNMATLQQIAMRLKSVTNIQKITNTMKMVSSAKFKRAENALKAGSPVGKASNSLEEKAGLTIGDEAEKVMIVAMSSDRGLCGGIHSGVCKYIRNYVKTLPAGTDYQLVAVGDKPRTILQRTLLDKFLLSFNGIGRKPPTFDEAAFIAAQILDSGYEADRIDLVFNHFKSAVSYAVERKSLPGPNALEGREELNIYDELDSETLRCYQEFTLASNIFHALLEGQASEQSSRMSAMENATKNAGEMIDSLRLQFNRSRQAVITNELTEIISGAAAIE